MGGGGGGGGGIKLTEYEGGRSVTVIKEMYCNLLIPNTSVSVSYRGLFKHGTWIF